MAESNSIEAVTGLTSTLANEFSSACFITSSRPYAVTITSAWRRRKIRQRANPLARLDAVHPRHLPVHKHNLVWMPGVRCLANHLDAFLP